MSLLLTLKSLWDLFPQELFQEPTVKGHCSKGDLPLLPILYKRWRSTRGQIIDVRYRRFAMQKGTLDVPIRVAMKKHKVSLM